MQDFRRFFVRGLAALVPTLLTFAIIVWAFRLINDNVGYYITEGLLRLCLAMRDEPGPGLVDPEVDTIRYGRPIDEWDEAGRRLTVEHKIYENFRKLEERKPERKPTGVLRAARTAKNEALWRIALDKYRMDLLSFLVGIILVYFTGFLLASFIGRTAWRTTEGLLLRVPVIRAIYPNVKQVTDFLLSERTVEFSGVVAVEYPRKGIWSVGLKTGAPLGSVQQRAADELVTIFIPSSPTPFTGYVIQAPCKDVIDLNITIDEGLRFTISGGVIKPDSALPPPAHGSGAGG